MDPTGVGFSKKTGGTIISADGAAISQLRTADEITSVKLALVEKME